MASRVSPRSNASSASSNSSVSRRGRGRGRRNPNPGRGGNSFDSDWWGPEAVSGGRGGGGGSGGNRGSGGGGGGGSRGGGRTGNKNYPQNYQQQHKGQWSQKSSSQAGNNSWSDSRSPNYHNSGASSWGSQKQQVETLHTELPYHRAYQQGQPPIILRAGDHWNQGTISTQDRYPQPEQVNYQLNYAQDLYPQPQQVNYQPNYTQDRYPQLEQVNYQPSYTKQNQNQNNSWSQNSSASYGRGNRGGSANPNRRSRDASTNLNCPLGIGHDQLAGNFGQYDARVNPSSFGPGAWHEVRVNDSNFGPGTRHEAQASNSGTRHEAPASNSASGMGDSRGGSLSYTVRKSVDFPPLVVAKGDARMDSSQTVKTSETTNSVWAAAPIKSWYDECVDDPDTSPTKAANESANEFQRVGWEKSNSNISNRINTSNDGYVGVSPHVAPQTVRKDSWRSNNQQSSALQSPRTDNWRHHTSNTYLQSSSRDSWRRRDSDVSRSSTNRSTSFTGRPGAGILGDGRTATHEAKNQNTARQEAKNQNMLVGHLDHEESIIVAKNPAPTVQVDAEGHDDEIIPFIVGLCEDMCPVKEREQRERLRDLAVFERVNGNPAKTSRELAVKKMLCARRWQQFRKAKAFPSRTFFGLELLPPDVRPLQTLKRTLQYLLNLLDDSEFTFDVVHNFLFDRTRAIRQELGMQRIANSQAITMYEEIVRFHILSEHELNHRGSARHLSDSHLNLQQLSKSLLSLFELYRFNTHQRHANEAEFRAYYVLLNLGSNSKHQADLLSVWFRQFPRAFWNARELQFARAVLKCYRTENFRRFFQLVEEATFLQGCLLELHFNEMRLKGLLSMNQGGYKLHPIPLSDIAKQLLIKEGDLEELCNLCGLATGMDVSRVRCLFVKQSPFSVPDEIPFYRCPCILNKQPASHYKAVTS